MPELQTARFCDTHIYETGYFELLDPAERELIENQSRVLTYRKGETLIKQGTFASTIFYLEAGLVKVFLEGNSKNLILNITPPDSLLGLQAVFEGNNTYPYSVSCYSETVVKTVDIAVFKQLLGQNAGFANRIINNLNESTAQTYGRFYSLTRKQLHGRLADILLCLSNRIFKSDTFNLPLTRSDLGELTSMATESVIRLLKEFHDDGLISITGKTIHLTDIPRLQRISELG